MVKSSPIVTVRPRRAHPVLICKKCLKRVTDGPKLKRALKSELKHRSVAQATKRPRVVMTGCFGLCPKRAIVLANGATLNRGEYLLLRDRHSSAAAADILMPEET